MLEKGSFSYGTRESSWFLVRYKTKFTGPNGWSNALLLPGGKSLLGGMGWDGMGWDGMRCDGEVFPPSPTSAK